MFLSPGARNVAKENDMLWAILVVLVVLWLLGFSFHIAGGLIHILLVAAVIILIINLWNGRNSGL
jgi:hypothetical protein